MGRIGLYVKISLLVAALVVVFFVIRGLNKEKVEGAFQALGIQENGQTSEASAAGATLETSERTLCQTRVHAIRFPNGDAVVEKRKGMDLNWTAEFAENPGKPQSLNYMAVEKWFSKNCKFTASKAPPLDNPEPSNEPVKYILVEFIDGSTWEIFREGDAFMSGADPKDRFISHDLEQAIQELRSITGFPVDSKDR